MNEKNLRGYLRELEEAQEIMKNINDLIDTDWTEEEDEDDSKELDEAYRKYQLLWCLEHGYSLEKIIENVVEIVNDSGMVDTEWIESNEVVEAFNEIGFHGELFACKDEFEDSEYADSDYRNFLKSL